MYVTRPLSLYRKNPSYLSLEPPDIPNSGILVVKDERSEDDDAYCCGMCYHKSIKSLPFPQDKILSVVHASEATGSVTKVKVWFLPVLNLPLCANLYYIIRAKGRYRGKAYISAKQADLCDCCFGNLMNDKSPRILDYRDIYQQFEIKRYHGGGYYAKSAADDGIPPTFLRKKGWQVRVSRSIKAELEDASGIDNADQATIPSLRPSFPVVPASQQRPGIVVGRWYVPFMFVYEDSNLKRHMKKTLLYQLTLEQYWEEFYSRENDGTNTEEDVSATIRVIGNVLTEEPVIYGMPALKEHNFDSSFAWLKVPDHLSAGRRLRLGLGVPVAQNMIGIQEERGWIGGGYHQEDMNVRVERMEEVRRSRDINNNGEWRKLGYYVLVESYYLRRLDGMLVMKYNFRHVHKIQSRWE